MAILVSPSRKVESRRSDWWSTKSQLRLDYVIMWQAGFLVLIIVFLTFDMIGQCIPIIATSNSKIVLSHFQFTFMKIKHITWGRPSVPAVNIRDKDKHSLHCLRWLLVCDLIHLMTNVTFMSYMQVLKVQFIVHRSYECQPVASQYMSHCAILEFLQSETVSLGQTMIYDVTVVKKWEDKSFVEHAGSLMALSNILLDTWCLCC